jgi:hypothetical protein
MPGKKTENYRPDLSSERTPHISRPETVRNIIKERMGKNAHVSQMGA